MSKATNDPFETLEVHMSADNVPFITTNQYWECSCPTNFNHPDSVEECPVCDETRDGSPNARVEDVLIQIGLPVGVIYAGLVMAADAVGESVPQYVGRLEDPERHVCHYECRDCGGHWPLTNLNPIRDIFKRVVPGDIMPAGECPQCGALCHKKD